ncbi:competence type IV pilus minor pilin ComGE [Bacillus altitudinis]|uniref:competence type IV pilus minor pilin ComGE n=1 Tax=Bacillus altitudinis TaxID=293387 RepID=UPI0011E93A49|nr:competence type IV pilus minor pilin ComGE [Bacillus altitudinis]TYS26909.1 type II secretion system protein [Bacillus altitudinis]
MFRNNKGFSTFEMLFSCHLFLFAALVLVPSFEKLTIGKEELKAKLEAYQILHEYMNKAFIEGQKKSSTKKRGENTYELNWSQEKGCVSYKVQKKKTICFRHLER